MTDSIMMLEKANNSREKRIDDWKEGANNTKTQVKQTTFRQKLKRKCLGEKGKN